MYRRRLKRRYVRRKRRFTGRSKRLLNKRIRRVVKRMGEPKYALFNVTNASTDANSSYQVKFGFNIPQGTRQTDRIGQTITPTRFRIRGRITLGGNAVPAGGVYTWFRILVGWFKSQPTNWPTSIAGDDMLDNLNNYSEIDTNLFRCVYDKTFHLCTDGNSDKWYFPSGKMFRVDVKWPRMKWDYKAAADNAESDFNKVPVMFIYSPYPTANQLLFYLSYNAKMNFRDM